MYKNSKINFSFAILFFTVIPFTACYGQQTTNNVKQTKTLRKLENAVNFIVMGDWGRNGEDHQQLVADQMGITAAEIGADFIISTGDNFYPSGVISEFDPLWRTSFEDIYTAFALQWDWYPVLGNHDYKSNPDAQVAYSKISRRWKMPARYYSKKIKIPGTNEEMLIAFIDTNPLIPEFYKNLEYGPNVQTQDSTTQKQWLRKELNNKSSNITWKFVVGHHPIFTGSDARKEGYDTKAVRNSIKKLIDEEEVDVYLAGHDHSLQHIAPKGKTHYFVSGAASEATQVGMLPDSKFAQSEYGFMLFSVNAEITLVQVIDYKGNLLYASEINKN
ncbi:purple acid phosphatase family protein [Chondrinema litorale]|uniref:purple acid phosphatase family protein n=1 Tax=Chondrinema litorale TaxID=2994555 RepID=UPI00254395B3|nr:tartrate-resistant acid phosphatase type 5 family protein [Chondrinema litorale]UZR98400.1 tartrate-resistant acid phosphatase type 5 family protein [Chondrinema litorale]